MGPQLFLEGIKNLIHRETLAFVNGSEPLLDCLDSFQPFGQIKQPLIGFSILHDDFRGGCPDARRVLKALRLTDLDPPAPPGGKKAVM